MNIENRDSNISKRLINIKKFEVTIKMPKKVTTTINKQNATGSCKHSNYASQTWYVRHHIFELIDIEISY